MLADMIDDPDPLSPLPPAAPMAATPAPVAVTPSPAAPAPAATPAADAEVPTPVSALLADHLAAPPPAIPVAEPLDASPVGIGELISQLSAMVAPAPPLPDTGVVAIVGPRGDAVEVAVALAQAWGRAPSEVLVAAPTDPGVTPETIGQVVAESCRRRTHRGQSGPALVAVAVMPGTEGHRWAATTLRAIAPAQVRLAVAGWRPLDRVAQTLAGLGSVDAVDLVALDGAAAPEAFLRLGVPVASVDGLPATPAMWAALLVDCGRAAAICEDHVVLDDRRAPVSPAPTEVRAPEAPVVTPVYRAPGEPVPATFPRVAGAAGAAR